MKISLNVICKLFFSKEILQNESFDNGKMRRIAVPIQIVCKELGAGNLVILWVFYHLYFILQRKSIKKTVQHQQIS